MEVSYIGDLAHSFDLDPLCERDETRDATVMTSSQREYFLKLVGL